MFRFKQFSVDQSGCAMKINTDGVLLGAMADADNPSTILDIGTGTGVIALMLAQRFTEAAIDAVEIDVDAAKTAESNFKGSVFNDRIQIYSTDIAVFFETNDGLKYDLIVSNPPFYLNSLESPKEKKSLAKHTDVLFFERLMSDVSLHLSAKGCCWLIYPYQEQALINNLIAANGLYLQKLINIHSFAFSEAHRQIACIGFDEAETAHEKFVIYESKSIYSSQYKLLLQPYFLAF